MKPLDPSSGDVLADRRADFADMLRQSGDLAAAADVMLQALEIAPSWAYGWFRLGEMHAGAQDADAAAAAFRRVLELDPSDRAGASLKLHLAGATGALAAMPAAFVETLFDQYARTFETSLVEKLGYRAPDLVRDAILAVHPARFVCAVDLGCGTGLMGERLRPVCDRLEGYDLSTGMLKRAQAKRIYDLVEQADLTVLRFDTPRADLVVAADVFIYVGALETAFANVRSMLLPGGLFAFTVEALGGADGFGLLDTRRFAHARAYVDGALAGAGFRILSATTQVIRRDREAQVEGLVVTARALD